MSSERERILALSPEELNREVATFMGWTEIGSRYFEVATSQWVYKPIRGEQGTEIPPGWCSREVPEYASDYNAVRTVEDEIERRGLWREYIASLMAVAVREITMPPDGYFSWSAWRMVHASAADRCRAALLCLGEKP